MVKTSFLAMSALSAVASAANDTYYTGDGTSYVMDPMAMKTGNCNFQGGWYDNELDIYAAINAEQWGLDQCGKCAEVTCIDSRCSAELQTQKHIVHVIDKCPECLFGALDMAAPVYKLITGRTPDRYKIKWRFVDCPNIKGNLMYCLQPSSKEWWGAVQVSNFKVPIAKVSINGKPAQQMANVDYWLIETSQAIDYTKLTISTTAVSGETITETVSVSLSGCTEGKQQFTQGGSTPAPTTTTLTPAPTSTTSTPAPTSTTSTPAPTSTTSTPVPTTTTTTPAPTSASPGAAMWGQCGGNGWSGPTTCSQGKCVKVNDWYSQCQ